MNTRKAVAAVVGFIAAGCAAQAAPREAPVPGPRPDFSASSQELRAYNALLKHRRVMVDTVLCGDSTLVGIRLPDLWPDGRVVNRSIGGDDSSNLRDRFALDVLELQPKHVVLSVGANDFWWTPENEQVRDPDEVISTLVHNVATIHDMCVDAGVKLTLCTLLPLNPELEWGSWRAPWVPLDAYPRANARLRVLCQERGIPMIDLYGLFVDERGYFSPKYTADGVHPNVAADIVIIRKIRDAVENGSADERVEFQPPMNADTRR